MDAAAEHGGADGDAAAAAATVAAMGAYGGAVRAAESAAEEILLLWALRQPTAHRHNAFVRHSAQTLTLDACGRHLSILQSPSAMSAPGVTGAVMWDSGVVLGKFLEHAVDSGRLLLRGRRAVELGAGCGLVGCIAALLGADVVLTDLPDRLKLLKKNVELNVEGHSRGSATVSELTWGDDPDPELMEPPPEFVLGSDVIYSEEAVEDLLTTLKQLSGTHTTIFLAGELRNDVVLECFLDAAMEDFLVGCIDQTEWHPDYRSNRVALFVLVLKNREKQIELPFGGSAQKRTSVQVS
ncbi:protein-lysine methyltransferase METTL21D isoform X2 [Ananas comosus]|uniref:Protein N-lysine methyltransferase METTL21A n=1 Tax=Ananas comosus TaxID=4615 RepID=A0A199W9M9_ANACO|nr:protein-lysine methyltransferase METTL21D isoform X2 [Ananas comosus]OAY85943.1 Protein N-lysine methyltransferase METTL21A [Ananas comosus]